MHTTATAEPTPLASPASNHGQIHSCSPPQAVRNRLPDERISVTHKFEVGGHEGYITVGLYPDRHPGELFITMAKEGSTVSGLISSFAQAISIGLQHGVPLKLFCEKFAHTRFEPSGWSGNPDIRHASSVMDYIFRWLQLRFGDQGKEGMPSGQLQSHDGNVPRQPAPPIPEYRSVEDAVTSSDAPACKHCGSITRRNGSCYVCVNCGSSSGCS
jgi:ribonucleoside-diphosphate reductase alpha chain